MVEAKEPRYYKNGQLVEQTVDGVRTVFFIDGTVKATGGVDRGMMHGEWHFYRKSGELWQVGHLDHDAQVGSWIRYHRDGSIEKSVVFENGKVFPGRTVDSRGASQ